MEILLMGSIFVFSALSLLSYILIVLNIDYLIMPIVILTLIFAYKPLTKKLKTIKLQLNKQTMIVFIVFALGIIGQLAIISPSGVFQNGDMVFWSAHGHDGMWHIALMEQMKKGLPAGRQDWSLTNPIFAGERLVNYHFFSDLLPAVASKYTPLTNLDLYFRIFPFFYSLFLGVSVYFLTKKITKNILSRKMSFSASMWAVIFTYFAGSFGYLIGKGESVFWATQPQSSSGNPPQIISNFLFLTSIYYVWKFLEQKKTRYFLISLVLLGTISSFKIYSGVILLGSFSILGIWRFIKTKKADLFLLSLLSGILSLCLYLPNSSGSTSFLIYEPWWYIRTMIVEPSRLNLLDWELRRQTYIYEHNWKRVIWLEGLGFIIFFFGNLGMRFLGLWEFVKSKPIFKLSIVLSLALPLIFLQKGVASNTAQFLQYFILLFGILAGIATAKLTSRFKVLVPVIILLMIPTQITLLKDFYGTPDLPRPAFTKISSQELEALEFVKQNTDKNSVILTPPYNQYLDLGDAIPNIWDWFDTSYVAALTSRHTYFDDYEQVDIMGYDYKPRLVTKKIIFESEDVEIVKEALLSTNANILYFPKATSLKINPEDLGLSKIFENSTTEVWKTN